MHRAHPLIHPLAVVFLLLLSITFSRPMSAQGPQGLIRGQVVDQAGTPVDSAEIRALGSAVVALSDPNGAFELQLPAGAWRLSVRTPNGRSGSARVRVTDGGTTEVTITLAPAVPLADLVVSGAGRQVESPSPYKLPASLLEIPQSVNDIPRQFIDDRNAVDLKEVLRGASGVTVGRNATTETIIRGFNDNGATTQFGGAGSLFMINGLRNYLQGSAADIRLANVDHVEVIKGSTGVLYGSNQPGGVINLATKQPTRDPMLVASVSGGSWDAFRADVDASGPVTADRRLLYRANIGFQSAPDYRDVFFNRNLTLAPTFTFQPTERTRVGVELIYNQSRRLAWYDWGIPARNAAGEDITRRVDMQYSSHQIGDFADLDGYGALLSLRHRLSSKAEWTTSASVSGNSLTTEGHYPDFGLALPDSNGNVGLQYRHYAADASGVFATNYLTLTFGSGVLRHRLVTGVDYFHGSNRGREITAYNDDANPTNVAPMNVFEPVFEARQTENYIYNDGYTSYTRVGFVAGYVQDLVQIGSRVDLLLGIRAERHRSTSGIGAPNVTSKPVNPNLGLVVRVLPATSVYASYTQGFTPQLTQDPDVGGPFDPLYSSQIEGGLKREWMDGRVVTTASVYQITRRNELVSANDPSNADRLEQTGRTRSEGVEVDIGGQVTPEWRLTANFAHNFVRVIQSDNAEIIGKRLPNAPANILNLWTRYDVRSGPVRGIGLGAGVTAVSKRFGGFEQSSYPGYATFDAAAYYTTGPVAVSLNVYNLGDRKYLSGIWSDFYTQRGLPRSAMLRVTTRF